MSSKSKGFLVVRRHGSGAASIAMAELQRPEWVEEDEEMGMEWDGSGGRGPSSPRTGRRRISVTLQRGNARVLRSGVLRARSGVGVRVYGHMGGSSLDVGTGD